MSALAQRLFRHVPRIRLDVLLLPEGGALFADPGLEAHLAKGLEAPPQPLAGHHGLQEGGPNWGNLRESWGPELSEAPEEWLQPWMQAVTPFEHLDLSFMYEHDSPMRQRGGKPWKEKRRRR